MPNQKASGRRAPRNHIEAMSDLLTRPSKPTGENLPMHPLFGEPEELLGTELYPSRPGEQEGNAFANPFSGAIHAGPSDAPGGSRREAYPTLLTHELGHTEQIEREGAMRTLMRAILGAGGSLLRGSSAHDPEKGSAVEREAQGLGIERVARYADQGDPKAFDLLQRITPMIEVEEKERRKRGEIP